MIEEKDFLNFPDKEGYDKWKWSLMIKEIPTGNEDHDIQIQIDYNDEPIVMLPLSLLKHIISELNEIEKNKQCLKT